MENMDRKCDVAIIGAGITGLTAARDLLDRGYSVLVLDKSRGVGGRMATRKYGDAWFDHGAQFLTAHGAEFQSVTNVSSKVGDLKPWFGQETGHIRYRGKPGMTAMAKRMSEDIRVNLTALVEKVVFENGVWSIEADRSYCARHLVIAYPVPQALELFESSDQPLPEADVGYLSSISYLKCLAVLLTLREPSGFSYPGILKYENPEPIELITDNQVKGVSKLPTLTVHAGPQFSDEYYTNREPALEKISKIIVDEHSIQIADAVIHGWKYARRKNESDRLFQGVKSLNLHFCGDSFGPPRIEGAFMSAKACVPSIVRMLESEGTSVA